GIDDVDRSQAVRRRRAVVEARAVLEPGRSDRGIEDEASRRSNQVGFVVVNVSRRLSGENGGNGEEAEGASHGKKALREEKQGQQRRCAATTNVSIVEPRRAP